MSKFVQNGRTTIIRSVTRQALGARAIATAGGGEVVVTRTVKDLVAGSGLRFDDRGEHQLKGIPDAWHLFALTA